MRPLPILSKRATVASSRLVNCKGCTVCCERGGLVYVGHDEVAGLKRLLVPLVAIDGVTFIKRLPDGSCPMLDRSGKKCSIYENRPLCCRLFPLDVLSISGRLQWALSTQCPEDRKLFTTSQGIGSRLGFGSVALIASMLDNSLNEGDAAYIARKEQVSARVEILDSNQNGWTPIAECAKHDDHIAKEMAKKKETEKEKFKRKLKEREEKKRKAREEKKRKEKDKKKKSTK